MTPEPEFAFPANSPWGQCLTQFLVQYGAARTFKNYRAILFQFLAAPAKMPDAYTIAEIEAYLASPIRQYRKKLDQRASSKGTRRIRHNALCGFYRYGAGMMITDMSGKERPLYIPSAEMDAFLFIGRKPKHLPPRQPKQPKVRARRAELVLPFSAESDWGRCYRQFLEQVYSKSGSKSSLDHYTATLSTFLCSKPILPDEFTLEEVQNYLTSPGKANGRVGNPPSAGLQRHRLSVLKSWYKYAGNYGVRSAEDGKIYSLLRTLAPTAGIRAIQRAQPPYKALAPEELRRFFAVIDRSTIQGKRDYSLFLAYFLLSRRRIEILNLRWGDIERTDTGYRYHFRNKGRSRQDDVSALPQQVYDAIIDYLKAAGKLDIIQPSWPIFTTCPDYIGQHGYDIQRPLGAQAVQHACKFYAEKASLDPKKVSCHSFRHSSARELYRAGLDLLSISHRLRHSNIATTHGYIMLPAEDKDPAAGLLESRFGNL
jgi:integrase